MKFEDWYEENFGAVEPGVPFHLPVLKFAYESGMDIERKKVAEWMTERGYTTGHGDTTIKLVRYLEWQVAEKERESCLKLADGLIRAIRTRGKPPPSGLYLVSEPTEKSNPSKG